MGKRIRIHEHPVGDSYYSEGALFYLDKYLSAHNVCHSLSMVQKIETSLHSSITQHFRSLLVYLPSHAIRVGRAFGRDLKNSVIVAHD